MSVEDVALTKIETIEETLFSIIQRTQIRESNESSGTKWIAIKTSTTHPRLSKEPHDIIKELRVMSSLSHPNIIPVLGSHLDQPKMRLRYWMPYIPCSLADLLESTAFSPHPLLSFSSSPSSTGTATPREMRFTLIAKSIIYQVLSALAYLHTPHPGREVIAHRDIKPANILLTRDGLVQVIDFGIVWDGRGGEASDVRKGDLWPEGKGKMYFEVATGPYRAPELLFGPLTYDAPATDLWSLGATFAEFFTSLHLSSSSSSSSECPPKPFILPATAALRPTDPAACWHRTTLFSAERGSEIGLAWSIFRVRGTPDERSWPTFNDLPDASKVTFVTVPAVDLASLLPNLPPSSLPASPSPPTSHSPPVLFSPTPFDLLHRLLIYPQQNRIRASGALKHPWFTANPAALLPAGYPLDPGEGDDEGGGIRSRVDGVWEGKTLGELLRACLPHM